MSKDKHLTTRRGFVAAIGFGGVSLYGLWAAYGAAPGPMALFGAGGAHQEGASHGGGHGAAAGHGPTADEFRDMVAEFMERYTMPDGSVYPRLLAPEPRPEMAMNMHAMPAAHGDGHAAPQPEAQGMDHASHTSMSQSHGQSDGQSHGEGHGQSHGQSGGQSHGEGDGQSHGQSHGESDSQSHGQGDDQGHGQGHGEADRHSEGPIDVYLIAEKWFYEPAHLRLDAGVPYRFRMMAADVSHGASIQFGRGGRMIRLRPNAVAEMEATFQQPGSFLVYCTVYCGEAHDTMQARIEVV